MRMKFQRNGGEEERGRQYGRGGWWTDGEIGIYIEGAARAEKNKIRQEMKQDKAAGARIKQYQSIDGENPYLGHNLQLQQ